MSRLFVLSLVSFPLLAQTPDAREIIRRVAANLERAQAARASYVYDQDVFVRLKRANGKLAQEESRRYTVTPTEKGAERSLVKVEGKILDGRKEINYTDAGFRRKDIDLDGAIVDSLAREIMWRKNTIGPVDYWFPLEHLEKYTFTLEGEERYHG
jgi:hypothetical protein